MGKIIKETPLSTAEVLVRLKARYSDTGYAVLTEVGNSTGFECNRWADALVMTLWPSRGLELHGFEIKVSRGDWKKELANPQKAEAVCKYCDRWWVVAGSKGIVLDGELPKTWGLLVADGTGLKTVKHAPELTPIALDRSFVAAICRRAAEQSVDDKTIKAAVNKAREEWNKDQEARRKRDEERTARGESYELQKLKRIVAEFEEGCGVKLDHLWERKNRKIGEAVRIVLDNDGMPPGLETLKWVKERVTNLLDELSELEPIIAQFEKPKGSAA